MSFSSIPYAEPTASCEGLALGEGRLWRSQLTAPKKQLNPTPDLELAGAQIPASDTCGDLEVEQGQCTLAGNNRIARLRHTIKKLEASFFPAAPIALSLGVPEIHRHLPGPGLACGVLHEVLAAVYADGPATVGFLFALTALALQANRGLAVLVTSERAFAEWGKPYAHGLSRFGVDPDRLMLVEAGSDKEALWAIEETLRSRVRPVMVTGALENRLDLTASRRLNLAAAALATPLTVTFRKGSAASAAATCWRIGAMPASRDRYGSLSHPRWNVSLERCRHGRPGKWVVEWNHVTHRFSLVQGMADLSSTQGSGLRIAARGLQLRA